ncbi:hypothetical protein L228DRAFT_176883 [Xylona heveae TC161]|uniref:Uncharacterized protein n=1 Tax=Xylona heveae (strain CBS 132557 / TC161) TaxID=1328760 RepID=A0A165F7N2_XYLHT|nr:hypothetical protein L228DRAFT_176883 [Xylona heveae TC161]KZF20670.1 hypothetical protein L228DRAFT_176883 [Xylona heveae TC161]
MQKPPVPKGDSLQELNGRFPYRHVQIRQLVHVLNPSRPSPPAIVVHGLNATGKSVIVGTITEAFNLSHAVIRARECITTRHLLERILAESLTAIRAAEPQNSWKGSASCENVGALSNALQDLLSGVPKFVLVLDDIDRQREIPPTLSPALARLGEVIPNLTVLFIMTSPRAHMLRTAGTPHIYFSPYTKDQSLAILSISPRSIFEAKEASPDPDYTEEQQIEDSAWIWSRFCGVVWDSIGKGAARDIISLRDAADKLWPSFVEPIAEGTYGTRDFSKLMIAKRALFQSDAMLTESVTSENIAELRRDTLKNTHELPLFSKFLLCASYLASFNPSRQDPIHFMKATEKKRRRKSTVGTSARATKHRKIQRRLLGPQAFVLERMLAIFQAICPRSLASSADLLTQVATLSSLRLIIRASGTADALEPQTKWRVNVGWDYILQLARSVDFEIEDHLAE